MRKRLLHSIYGLSMALLCNSVTLADSPAATQSASAEPPLEYVLNIDGKDVPIASNQPASVKIGDRDLQVRLTPKAERLLKLPGLSISYPNYYTFKTDQSDPSAPQWELKGRDTVLIVTGGSPVVSAKALESATAAALAAKFRDKKVTRTATDVTFVGKKITAARLDFGDEDLKLYYIIFAVETKTGPYVIICQGVAGTNGADSEETTTLLGLFKKAVVAD